MKKYQFRIMESFDGGYDISYRWRILKFFWSEWYSPMFNSHASSLFIAKEKVENLKTDIENSDLRELTRKNFKPKTLITSV